MKLYLGTQYDIHRIIAHSLRIFKYADEWKRFMCEGSSSFNKSAKHTIAKAKFWLFDKYSAFSKQNDGWKYMELRIPRNPFEEVTVTSCHLWASKPTI